MAGPDARSHHSHRTMNTHEARWQADNNSFEVLIFNLFCLKKLASIYLFSSPDPGSNPRLQEPPLLTVDTETEELQDHATGSWPHDTSGRIVIHTEGSISRVFSFVSIKQIELYAQACSHTQ